MKSRRQINNSSADDSKLLWLDHKPIFLSIHERPIFKPRADTQNDKKGTQYILFHSTCIKVNTYNAWMITQRTAIDMSQRFIYNILVQHLSMLTTYKLSFHTLIWQSFYTQASYHTNVNNGQAINKYRNADSLLLNLMHYGYVLKHFFNFVIG